MQWFVPKTLGRKHSRCDCASISRSDPPEIKMMNAIELHNALMPGTFTTPTLLLRH